MSRRRKKWICSCCVILFACQSQQIQSRRRQVKEGSEASPTIITAHATHENINEDEERIEVSSLLWGAPPLAPKSSQHRCSTELEAQQSSAWFTFTPLAGDALDQEYSCRGEPSYPALMTPIACWDVPGQRWCSPEQCLFTSLEGSNFQSVLRSSNTKGPSILASQVVAGCLNETSYRGYGIEAKEIEKRASLLHDGMVLYRGEGVVQAQDSSCERVKTSRAEDVAFASARLKELSVLWGGLRDDLSRRCLAFFAAQPWRDDWLDDTVEVSAILSVKSDFLAGQELRAYRAINLFEGGGECELSVLLGQVTETGAWEVVGWNGEDSLMERSIHWGPVYLDEAQCQDINGTSGPELYIPIGYESMRGLVLLSTDRGRVEMLHVEYLGD